MRIVLAGIMGRYPYGGVAWCSLQYLLGLRQLGHDVWYLEDTGECNYDPLANTLATEPSYALTTIRNTLEPRGFGDRWCYIDFQGKYHGMEAGRWRSVCADADLFLDLSGGCWFWRDEYAVIPHTAFIDTDPAFTQLALAGAVPWYVDFFSRFGTVFTFGSNIGTSASAVPTGDLRWHHTWQPVCLEEWTSASPPSGGCLTTIMTWRIESFDDIGGNKEQEFGRIADLPGHVAVPLEIALNGPDHVLPAARQLLCSHGWRYRDALSVSRNVDVYRDYIRGSLGEVSVAKSTYVRTNSGWFSDRTQSYLAAGRPAVVQDTGFSAHLPHGEGLFPFTDLEGAVSGIDQILADPVRQRRAARDLAREHFAHDVVLPALLATATSGSRCG